MDKKILVTISDNTLHLFGIEFINTFFSPRTNFAITLLHVCRSQRGTSQETITKMWEGGVDDAAGNVSVAAQKAIRKAKGLLQQHQMDVSKIVTKTISERYGKVRDILAESEKGLYDAIILGRRASYALQWMFETPADETILSITKQSNCTTPLWICPDTDKRRKDVLACIDGSENSFRMIDHLGHMLADEQQHSIHLFRVKDGATDKFDQDFKRCTTILTEHKISSDRIQTKTGTGFTTSGAIKKQAEKENYAIVGVGMRGINHDRAGHGLAGDVTRKLISELEKTALVCCP